MNTGARRRVVVTGVGLISPLGIGTDVTWQGLMDAKSGIGPVTRFDISDYPSRIGGEVDGFDPSLYVHGIEGPDDMPAHIRTVLSGVTLSIPIIGGRLSLGTWQGVYLWEHRDRPHRREVAATLVFV